ncbi:hypothetical protein VU08_07525 [Desulfobulbus sp. F5]|nr:hypothetical protein [Desulfobulbus sp. F5]
MQNKGTLYMVATVSIVAVFFCCETKTAYPSDKIDQSSAGDNSPVVNSAGNVIINIFPQGKIKEDKDKSQRRTYRAEPDGEGALTPEMIEQCIYLNMDVDASYSAIGKAKEQFDALNKKMTEAGEWLKAVKNQVVESNRADYDAAVMKYNGSIPYLDKLLNRYKQIVSVYKQKSDKFDRECNGQPYYEDDYAAMVKKTGRGM